MGIKRKTALVLCTIVILLLIIAQIIFPGRKSIIAFTLATGVGTSSLQKKVILLQNKAIHLQPFSKEEKEFVFDLYKTMAIGAKLLPWIRQTGLLMDHYLSKKGSDLKIEKSIFVKNKIVQQQMDTIKKRIKNSRSKQKKYQSKTFYMPHKSSIDSVFGLYWGKIIASPEYSDSGIIINWRAEVPWKWPSYQVIKKKYGSYKVGIFPLPNLKSIIMGKKYCLHINNGLGAYLTKLGLAKSFTAYAEWKEEL